MKYSDNQMYNDSSGNFAFVFECIYFNENIPVAKFVNEIYHGKSTNRV